MLHKSVVGYVGYCVYSKADGWLDADSSSWKKQFLTKTTNKIRKVLFTVYSSQNFIFDVRFPFLYYSYFAPQQFVIRFRPITLKKVNSLIPRWYKYTDLLQITDRNVVEFVSNRIFYSNRNSHSNYYYALLRASYANPSFAN